MVKPGLKQIKPKFGSKEHKSAEFGSNDCKSVEFSSTLVRFE